MLIEGWCNFVAFMSIRSRQSCGNMALVAWCQCMFLVRQNVQAEGNRPLPGHPVGHSRNVYNALTNFTRFSLDPVVSISRLLGSMVGVGTGSNVWTKSNLCAEGNDKQEQKLEDNNAS